MKLNTQNAEFILSAAKLADCPRDSLPQIAFAGRSNVGKSSGINRLLGRRKFARVGAAPGKTPGPHQRPRQPDRARPIERPGWRRRGRKTI